MVIGLSHKVVNFEKLNIAFKHEEGDIESTVVPNGSKNISSSWILKFNAGKHKSVDIKIAAQTAFTVSGDNYPATQFHSQDGVKLFRPFHASVDLSKGKDTLTFTALPQEGEAAFDDDLLSNLESIVDQEYNTIKELTDFEKELRFALLRQVELL